MINKNKTREKQLRRAERIRYKLKKNTDRPRLVLNKTNRYITVQIIDDSKGNTLAAASTSEKDFPIKSFSRKNKNSAQELGKIIAERAKSKGIARVKLDRSGSIFHGNIASFAESAREGGLEF
ncbi:MAG: 50S ribosomal protein L18 [Leptospiraceae bacterium]|nr:50S ribosomal protein L18 [Leptospiraceae bacterium]MCP5511876.1 50S ribosomal protein L18 [Leptospiraceae bacterium]